MLSGDALDDEHEILLRLGKSGLKMHKRLSALGLPLTTVCRTVKDAAMSDELPGLDEPPWAEFPGRPSMMRALQARAKAWKDAPEAARRKILLKAITAGITPLPSEPIPTPALSSAPSQGPAQPERAQVHEEQASAAPGIHDMQALNLAVLNGAIGALSTEELSSDEAIRARLDARQARLLEHGLHAYGLTLAGVCTFVKAASSSDTAPHFDGEPWQRFPATHRVRAILHSSAVGWAAAKEITRRKTLLKAIGDAIKGTSGSGDDMATAVAAALPSPTLSITLDAHSMSLVDDIRARVKMPVGIDELLLAGLIGLSEFDDDDILDLISDVRDAAGAGRDSTR